MRLVCANNATFNFDLTIALQPRRKSQPLLAAVQVAGGLPHGPPRRKTNREWLHLRLGYTWSPRRGLGPPPAASSVVFSASCVVWPSLLVSIPDIFPTCLHCWLFVFIFGTSKKPENMADTPVCTLPETSWFTPPCDNSQADVGPLRPRASRVLRSFLHGSKDVLRLRWAFVAAAVVVVAA